MIRTELETMLDFEKAAEASYYTPPCYWTGVHGTSFIALWKIIPFRLPGLLPVDSLVNVYLTNCFALEDLCATGFRRVDT